MLEPPVDFGLTDLRSPPPSPPAKAGAVLLKRAAAASVDKKPRLDIAFDIFISVFSSN